MKMKKMKMKRKRVIGDLNHLVFEIKIILKILINYIFYFIFKLIIYYL